MKRRGRTDIIYDILFKCRKWTKITPLVYGLNLSFDLARKYIIELKKQGLLQQKKNTYGITRKGEEFLKSYHKWRFTIGGDVKNG